MQNEEQHPLVSSKERLVRAQLQERDSFVTWQRRLTSALRNLKCTDALQPMQTARCLPKEKISSHFPVAEQPEAAWWLQVAQEHPPNPGSHLLGVATLVLCSLPPPAGPLGGCWGRQLSRLVPYKHTTSSQVKSSQLTQPVPPKIEAGKA